MFQQDCTVKTPEELNLREKFKDIVVVLSDVSGFQQRIEKPDWMGYTAGTGKPKIITNIHMKDGNTLCSNFTVDELFLAIPEFQNGKDMKITVDVNGGSSVYQLIY